MNYPHHQAKNESQREAAIASLRLLIDAATKRFEKTGCAFAKGEAEIYEAGLARLVVQATPVAMPDSKNQS